MTYRIGLHLTCMLVKPANWKFYLKGIMREIGVRI